MYTINISMLKKMNWREQNYKHKSMEIKLQMEIDDIFTNDKKIIIR